LGEHFFLEQGESFVDYQRRLLCLVFVFVMGIL
jgi:hypothetical protein